MAKEVTVHSWCDIHLAESEGVTRINARTIPVQIEGHSVEIDLCDEHELELVKPLLDVMLAHGAKVGQTPAPKRAPGEHLPKEQCLRCGAEFAIGASLRNHYIVQHGETEADAKGEATMWCPECSQGYSSVQGIGMHLMRSHSINDKPKRDALIAASGTKPGGKARSTGSRRPAPRKASQSKSRTATSSAK